MARQQERYLWDKVSFSVQEATIPYSEFMSERQSLANVLHHLWRTGLVFISDVPKEHSSVQELAERIGPLYNSFYGLTWDVRSSPNAKNVAYTNRHLGFHMDLLYMRVPPQIQLLHCFQNSCTGGESQFTDSYKALDRILSLPDGQDVFSMLLKTSVRYEYTNDGRGYHNKWPTVSLIPQHFVGHRYENADHPDIMSRLQNVYWSPPFESTIPDIARPLEKPTTRARHQLARVMDAEESTVETKLPEGTCAIFDNLRVLHARKAFDIDSGHRWLRGAYVGGQDFLSALSGLQDLLPKVELKYSPQSPETSALYRREPTLLRDEQTNATQAGILP